MVVRRTSDGRSRLEDVCPYLDVAKVYIRDFYEIILEFCGILQGSGGRRFDIKLVSINNLRHATFSIKLTRPRLPVPHGMIVKTSLA